METASTGLPEPEIAADLLPISAKGRQEMAMPPIQGIKQETAGLAYRLQKQCVQALSLVSESRDSYLSSHQRRVAHLAQNLAIRLGLAQPRVEGLYFAGLLHDIGKIGVPGEILCKTTKLNSDEMGIVRRHCESGYNMLKDIEFSWPIALAALQHHERVDGSGYPQGLDGDEILLESKIVAVADVVEAIASARPYRPSKGIAFALNEITSNSGVLFDSAVVGACLALFSEGYRLKSVSK
ncbi:MAG: HD-GYP domain-containing protein [Negativicutes bacterium]|nr:HD-GYP domain-containing protein [Negativicutes bacterium]